MPGMNVTVVEFEGKSGTTYPFSLYRTLPRFKQPIECVYMIVEEVRSDDYEIRHVGNTENFDEETQATDKKEMFTTDTSSCFAILPLDDEAARKQVSMDLFKKHMQALGGDFINNIENLMGDLDAIE